MAFSGSQTTRLGVSGFARGLYGSFASKTPALGPGENAPVIAVVIYQPRLGPLRVKPDLGPLTVQPDLGQLVVGN